MTSAWTASVRRPSDTGDEIGVGRVRFLRIRYQRIVRSLANIFEVLSINDFVMRSLETRSGNGNMAATVDTFLDAYNVLWHDSPEKATSKAAVIHGWSRETPGRFEGVAVAASVCDLHTFLEFLMTRDFFNCGRQGDECWSTFDAEPGIRMCDTALHFRYRSPTIKFW
jgi:hypothetical protein